MSDSKLRDDIHITDILGCNFFIPAYQRGYKWCAKDVEYLIRDLNEYQGDKPYYMQPLVVARKDGKIIVVDGQQRLTTFFLIWRRLYENGELENHPFDKSNCFSLEYENRRESTSYLSFQDERYTKETPDVRNFKRAESTIDTLRSLIDMKHFEKVFFEQATFLWYELDDPNEGPKTFEKLNGKRIALTDVELCKVFLLSNSCTTASQRNERAAAWQSMEYRFQNDKFYSFISKNFNSSHDQSRMSHILDVSLDRIQEEQNEYLDYPLYNRIKNDTAKGVNVWKRLVQTFHRMEMMYDNPLYYNLVGFLIAATNTQLRDIMDDVVSSEFGPKLIKRVTDWVETGTQLSNLVYKDNKTYSALLLFNILCDLIERKTSSTKIEDKYGFTHRFRFDLLRDEGYDKEHVHATNSQRLRSAIEWQQWIKCVLKYLPSERINLIDESHLSTMKRVRDITIMPKKGEDDEAVKKRLTDAIAKELNSEKFAEIFDKVNSIVNDGDDNEDKQNSIGNMALLNAAINRDPAYAASPFAIKKSIIHERINEGAFVPKGTQLMFDKTFRNDPDELYHWAKDNYFNGSESDKDSFIKFFVNTINKLKA